MIQILKKIRKYMDGRIIHRSIKYSQHFICYDQFGSYDDRHKFEYDITISKLYTTLGIYWEIDMPNYRATDKNFYRLTVRCIDYATTKFPQYFRLEEELMRKGLWKNLG